MITKSAFIVDSPLPEALNFTALKTQGLNTLKSLAGHKWSNYNESDPGVTILDQLCYALTELGYCSQFSIADVLTQSDGNIKYHDQFFEPQNILTCSPITLEDYRKLIVDHFDEVNNFYIEVEKTKAGKLTGFYLSYIYFKNELQIEDRLATKRQEAIITKVHDLLMKHRNICEVFTIPKVLQPKTINIAGRIYLTKTASKKQIYSQIVQALNHYVSPLVKQSGYQQLINEGLNSDQIFNGPKLQNGWITGQCVLGEKRALVSLDDITTLITKIEGVMGIELITLSLPITDESIKPSTPESLKYISIATNEIANIQASNNLELVQNSDLVQNRLEQLGAVYLSTLKSSHRASSIQAAVDMYPQLPKGQFRDIEHYYSIQNTFPDIYAIGPNSLQSDAPSYRVAQSRQLKGYLMIYDQLLANQFAQLAHIDDLFSFQQTYIESDNWPKIDPTITHKKFATTYYVQALYDIPDINSLLLGHNSYLYQYDAHKSRKLLERKAWDKYKHDPFNQYIYNLRHSIESDEEAVDRRDQMLTHLMARQGDDASHYDDMIKACHWYGSEARTRVIIKSIWLQNTKNLSYYRTCAYRYHNANLLGCPGRFNISKNDFIDYIHQLQLTTNIDEKNTITEKVRMRNEHLLDDIKALMSSKKINQHDLERLSKLVPITDKNKQLKMIWEKKSFFPQIDGQLDQRLIFSRARLISDDFDNYSTFELKLNILLGLQQHLLHLASILVALFNEPDFISWLKDSDSLPKKYYLLNSDITVVRNKNIDQIFDNGQCLMDIDWFKTTDSMQPPDSENYQDYIDQLCWLAQQRKGLLLIEHVLLLTHQESIVKNPDLDDSFYNLQASLFFPSYITLFQQDNFKQFIATLVTLHWPAHVGANCQYVSFSLLQKLIPNFCTWFNGLINGAGLSHLNGITSINNNSDLKAKQVKQLVWNKAATNLAKVCANLQKNPSHSTEVAHDES